MNEATDTVRYTYNLSNLGSKITGAMDIVTTPAEFSALGWVDPLDWSAEDMKQLLAPRNIDIAPLTWTEFQLCLRSSLLRDTIFICLGHERAWILSFDEVSSSIKGISTDPNEYIPVNGPLELFSSFPQEWEFFRCNRRTVENLAIFPGIEVQWFWSTIWKNRDLYIQSALASFLTNFFALGTSLFAMIVYNRIIPSNALESLTVLVSGMLLLMVVDYAIRSIRNHFLSAAGIDSDLALADRLFTQVMDLQFKTRKGSVGALANTLKEFEHIREFFASATLVSLIDVPFAFIFLLAIILVGNWMALPVVIGIFCVIAVTLYIQPRMKALAKSSFEDGQSKHSVLVESLTGLETIKLLGAGGFMRRRLRVVLERQADVSEQTKNNTHFSSNFAQSIQQLVQMAVVAVGAYLVSDGHIAYGAIIAATMLSGKALAPFAQVSQLMVRLNQINVSYEALNELMKQPKEHPEDKFFLPRERFKGSIEFVNVTFTYPGQQSPVLQDVSFKINAGERVAMLGHVGSGKTTISRLIAGLYEADSGSILIDGIDVRQIAPSNLRENIGFSMQDVWLMSATVEQNITLGAIDTRPEDILWAGAIAGVSDFVDKHPDGYKLVLKERGESLSGGQRQTISLARALVRKPAMVILDEPTSSMDARSEQVFVNRFKNSGLPSTLVVITHRTSLLTLVDRVVILENGKVAGMGTTEQFMKAQTDREVAAEIVRNAANSPIRQAVTPNKNTTTKLEA
jgi:ATP-binding cassette subfamily C protein LapB